MDATRRIEVIHNVCNYQMACLQHRRNAVTDRILYNDHSSPVEKLLLYRQNICLLENTSDVNLSVLMVNGDVWFLPSRLTQFPPWMRNDHFTVVKDFWRVCQVDCVQMYKSLPGIRVWGLLITLIKYILHYTMILCGPHYSSTHTNNLATTGWQLEKVAWITCHQVT